MKTKPHRCEFMVDDAFYQALDDWRRDEKDLPGRSEAIRRVVMAAGATRKAKEPPEAQSAPIATSKPAKATSKPRKPKRIKSERKPSSGELERRRIRKLITDAPGWETYRVARGYKVENLGKMALCLEIAKDLNVPI